MSKIILVTGGNAGIGLALVRLLAEKGHIVYIGSRNEEAGKKIKDELISEGLTTVKDVQLDVTQVASIQAAKDKIEQAEGRLDVLVNNAGISRMDAQQIATSVEVSVMRDTMETNFFGLVQTTTTLLPLLRKSPQAVILNVSMEMGSNTLMSRPEYQFLHKFVAYNTSKAAMNSYTVALAYELKDAGIKVNAVCPGFCSTKLNFFAEGGKTAKEGAELLLPYALLDKDGITGKFVDSRGDDSIW
ncbi:(+)-neomenthol dehydrogenase [Psilocybe cubensis]|uniref:Uncharacterized protein n=2 Tax=Psilocybe cubensis TaxID=181762 RepID=A0A8H8CQ01_PSICU|nr:(+)-neomenthol dehydrogenase [Psilocybe cubensis]KAH9486081.1 (+)-neomenthol dehydrogenase [Psilocybe cubensis]